MIKVEGLGKRYWIGAARQKRDRLGEVLVESFEQVINRPDYTVLDLD